MGTAAIQQESSQSGAGTRGQRRRGQHHRRRPKPGARLPVIGSATGPRGGRYVARSDGSARLVGVRVVRDATVSGVLSPTPAGIAGTVRLSGSSIPAGRLRVQLAGSGRGHATGTLNGKRVALAFRAI
jgi:hypothetical protein